MNVFFVPSWYPPDDSSVDGIFQRDQALALADLRPKWNVAVSRWAQTEGAVWVTRPGGWPTALRTAFLDRRPKRRRLRDNLVEYWQPTLSWTHVVLGGNRSGILRANRANLRRAASDVGRIDVIHGHVSYPGGWVAMQLSEETGIPYVVTEHMGPFPLPGFSDGTGRLRDIVREPLTRAEVRIAVSPALAAEMAATGIGDVGVIPNVVDETFFFPQDRPHRERFVFFTLAAMVTRKGILDLLRAIRRFLDGLPENRRSDVEFRIGGEGAEGPAFQRIASELGLDPWLTWLGFLPRHRARSEYQSCDCFVLASRHESFGVVYAEAIACGRPIIATRCGGPESIVTPENGLLVTVGHLRELASALDKMFHSARSYDPLVIRRQFLERFSRPAVVRLLEEAYGTAIRRHENREPTP